jgi:hypothetical protein
VNVFLPVNAVSLILSIGYGWLAGDRVDRQAVTWIAAALLATLAISILVSPEWAGAATLAVDMVLLAAIVEIALRSCRYWPIWFAGFHLAAVCCGVAALLAPVGYDSILRIFAGFWGIPALLAMVLGIFLDRRAHPSRFDQAQPST